MENQISILKSYFAAAGVSLNDVSPNLVASVCFDYFPHWGVTSEEVVQLSDALVEV